MKLIFRYLKPYWIQVTIIILLVTGIALSALLLPDFMSRLIGEGISAQYYQDGVLVDSCSLSVEGCTVTQVSDFSIILRYSGIMLGVTLASSLAAVALMYFSSHVGTHLSRDLRSDLYKKVNSLSIAETSKFGTSTLITRATNDLTQIQNFIMMSLRMVLRIPVMMIGGIVFALRKSVALTGVLGISVPFLAVMIGIVFVIAIPLFKQQQNVQSY